MKTAVRTYAVLWAATAVGTLLAGAGGIAVVRIQSPRDALAPTTGTALGLMAHNALVALWPLALAALRWSSPVVTRTAGDAMVVGQLLLHGLIVGGAIGQHPELWRYLPHLPLEWLGLALPAAGWLLARRAAATSHRLAVLAATSIAALAGAAALETWAVPL